MVSKCELRQSLGWFNRDTISGAYKCSDSPTEIRPQSLIGKKKKYSNKAHLVLQCTVYTMIVSSLRIIHAQSPLLTIGRTVLKESDDLDLIGVTFEYKMKQLRRFPLQLLKGLDQGPEVSNYWVGNGNSRRWNTLKSGSSTCFSAICTGSILIAM